VAAQCCLRQYDLWLHIPILLGPPECDQNGSALELRLLDSSVVNHKEITTMSNQPNRPKLVISKTPTETEKLEDQQKLDRVANDAAEQAVKTEQRYDQGHDIFTK
jgi:hypothetical protein